jgi:probable HAF family extracellular repeat protein
MQFPKPLLPAAAAAVVLSSSWAQAAEAPRYRVDFSYTHTTDSRFEFEIRDLNNKGEMVGMRRFGTNYTGFLYSGGEYREIKVPGARNTHVWLLNDRGDVAGTAISSELGLLAFRYNAGRVVDVGSGLNPPMGSPSVRALNQAGHVLGSDDSMETERDYFYDGRMARELKIAAPSPKPDYIGVTDLNDHDVVLGEYYDRETMTGGAFLYDNGTVTKIPASSGLRSGYALNNAGDIVGTGHVDAERTAPVLYRDGVATSLGTLGGFYGGSDGGWATDINDRGQIIGAAARSDTEYAPFLYQGGRMYDVDELLVARDAAQWDVETVYRINASGQILAAGMAAAGQRAWFLLSPVPEAQTWALMLAGLGLVGTVARRRAAPVLS